MARIVIDIDDRVTAKWTEAEWRNFMVSVKSFVRDVWIDESYFVVEKQIEKDSDRLRRR